MKQIIYMMACLLCIGTPAILYGSVISGDLTDTALSSPTGHSTISNCLSACNSAHPENPTTPDLTAVYAWYESGL